MRKKKTCKVYAKNELFEYMKFFNYYYTKGALQIWSFSYQLLQKLIHRIRKFSAAHLNATLPWCGNLDIYCTFRKAMLSCRFLRLDQRFILQDWKWFTDWLNQLAVILAQFKADRSINLLRIRVKLTVRCFITGLIKFMTFNRLMTNKPTVLVVPCARTRSLLKPVHVYLLQLALVIKFENQSCLQVSQLRKIKITTDLYTTISYKCRQY